MTATVPATPPPASACGGTCLLAVIGLYNMAAADSASFQTLQVAASRLTADVGSLSILLFDNTPDGEHPKGIPSSVRYQIAGHNAGLADAFNYGLATALREGYDWLITLDQDTELPIDFVVRIAEIANQLERDPSIAAIVPQISGDGRMLSPNRFLGGAIPKWFPRGFVGVPDQPTFAFNSASTLRVRALRQIGGYSKWFWLDNSDAMLYHRLHQHGKRVFVAGDLQVNHQFSMLDIEKRMTVSRYHNILMAESAFWDLAMNRLAGMERTFVLFGRWFKQVIRREKTAFRRQTLLALKRRLFMTRQSRIDFWKTELEHSRPSLAAITANPLHPERPKISVCMATCNGERFIHEQLSSVLPQLNPEDEVIVVDDASEDRTREIIAGFYDKRICVVQHQIRQGVVKTFEHAVRCASGDILFLCDQDDLWAAQKVTRVMRTFRDRPEVMIVTSNSKTIDASGNSVHDEIYSKPRRFTAALLPNLLSNTFQGSTMAFRSKLVPRILPFPQGCHLLHDVWIGLRNTLTGGETYFIDEPLLLYRRHSLNASNRLSLLYQILKRMRLLLALAIRSCKDMARSSNEVAHQSTIV